MFVGPAAPREERSQNRPQPSEGLYVKINPQPVGPDGTFPLNLAIT